MIFTETSMSLYCIDIHTLSSVYSYVRDNLGEIRCPKLIVFISVKTSCIAAILMGQSDNGSGVQVHPRPRLVIGMCV